MHNKNWTEANGAPEGNVMGHLMVACDGSFDETSGGVSDNASEIHIRSRARV